MTQITVTLDDQVLGERVQVNLDASLPVGQVLDALIQLRRLPRGTQDRPIIYDLIRVYNDQPLRTDLSLAAQGVQPGEELILAERSFGLDERSKLLLGLGALGILAVLCVASVLIITAINANRSPEEANAETQIAAQLTADAVTAIADQPTTDPGEATPTDAGEVVDDEQGCTDDLAFIADITIPDDTEFTPGESFTKTWRVQNTGTCDWTSDYLFLYVDGAQMSGPNGQILGQEVPAGRQTDISVNFRAPDDPGTYTSYWQMQNAENEIFGVNVFTRIIVVEATPTPTLTPTALPDTTVNLTIDPLATIGPYDLVDISATTSIEVPIILIVVEGEDEEGETFEVTTFTCENTTTCAVEYGGNDNTYAGTATVTAYACPAVSGCVENNVGSATGSFVINADIEAPDPLLITDEGTAGGSILSDVTISWSGVPDALEYRYGYQLEGSERVEVGTTAVSTTNATFNITNFSYPIRLWVQACNDFGCSDPAQAVLSAP